MASVLSLWACCPCYYGKTPCYPEGFVKCNQPSLTSVLVFQTQATRRHLQVYEKGVSLPAPSPLEVPNGRPPLPLGVASQYPAALTPTQLYFGASVSQTVASGSLLGASLLMELEHNFSAMGSKPKDNSKVTCLSACHSPLQKLSGYPAFLHTLQAHCAYGVLSQPRPCPILSPPFNPLISSL